MPELERARSEWSSRHRAGWRGSQRPSLTRENPTAPASSGTAPSQPLALAPQGAPRPTVAWSGPSRPLLQFPGLAPIVRVLPACQAPGPGPREGGAAGKLARCPRGASLGRRPGAAGGGGNKGLILPVRSRWHRRGVGGSPRGPGVGRPRRGRRITGSCFPQGAGGGNRRSSFPTLSCASGDGDQRSCCALCCALPPLAALRRFAPSLVPLFWVPGSAPPSRHDPLPRPLGLSPTRPSPTRGARCPRPGSLSPSGDTAP